MASNPSYVRLAPARQLTIVADVLGGTGWSISGTDVKPFPDAPAEQDYVRGLVRSGVLEPCSRAEYEEIQDLYQQEYDSEAERVEAAAELARKRNEEVAEIVATAEDDDAEDEDVPNSGATAGGLPPSDTEAQEVEDELSDLKVPELRDRLKKADQPTSGTKEELLERLRSLS